MEVILALGSIAVRRLTVRVNVCFSLPLAYRLSQQTWDAVDEEHKTLFAVSDGQLLHESQS